MNNFNNKLWTAINSNSIPGEEVLPESPELEDLLGRHPNAAHFYKAGSYNIRLVTCSVLNPIDAIDVTGFNEDGTPTYTTEDLINLLLSHKTDNGVLMRPDQATAVYNVLHVPTEKGMV